MISQRVGVAALRRAAKPSGAFFTPNLARQALLPAVQTRPVATQKITNDDGAILAAQRKLRPVSPHLEVYDPLQTWFGASAWQRITGSIFSGGLYVFATAYLAAPLLGWHLETASIVALVGGLPLIVKGGIKTLLAFPFAFHAINGVRHLVYDVGVGFSKSQVVKGGYYILGASVLSSLYLAFFV